MRRAYRMLLVLVWGFVFYSDINAQVDTLPQLPGRIAYIGADFNVYTMIPEETRTIQLTADGGSRRGYQWPTWSTDGRLAYFLTSIDQTGLSTEAYVSHDGEVTGSRVYRSTTELFTYASWSPQNCSVDEKCRNLAVLLSNTNNPLFSVKLIHHDSDQIPETLTGQGSPFYYSWSPNGRQMLWQRNNRRLDIYDVTSESIADSMTQTLGSFQAPSWSPVDNRWMFGVMGEDGQTTDLVIVNNDDTQILAQSLTGPIAFSWSPDGNLVAYTDAQGTLIIVESRTGRVITRSSVSGTLAFFWSPDSKHVAYITFAEPPGSFSADENSNIKTASIIQNATGIAWSILDIDTGATRRYGSFLPTREMIYLLSFFDQFSQSHRIWSPDSHYLIYSQISDNGSHINILNAIHVDAMPTSIVDGVIAIWSFS